MPGSGVYAFLGADRYETVLRRAQIGLTLICRADFKGCLTTVGLHHAELLSCAENGARIGYLSLPPLACISFPGNSSSMPTWGGITLEPGDIMFHSLGERLHQAMPGATRWGLIAVDPAELDHYCRTLFERSLATPLHGQVLRPARRDAARLRRLYVQVVRLAKTKPTILSHPEAGRALEHDLIEALVICLAGANVHGGATATSNRSNVMVRLEELMAAHRVIPPLPRLCELLGIKVRTLHACCRQFLGINAARYLMLCRLRKARGALRDADPTIVDVGEIARYHGFTNHRHFARAYRMAFGASPTAGRECSRKHSHRGQSTFPKSA